MLETMKRNKILTYAFLMAFPMTVGSIFSSCTDDFEKLNTSNIQVNPADLPFAAQCTEPMTYCYPPQQNMFQFWTNLYLCRIYFIATFHRFLFLQPAKSVPPTAEKPFTTQKLDSHLAFIRIQSQQ